MTLAERRASRGGPTLADEAKIPEENEDDSPEEEGKTSDEFDDETQSPPEEEKWEKAHEKKERAYRQLRGKTLGVFGPDNALRQAAARVLTLPCVFSF
jgi:hypothetical protein